MERRENSYEEKSRKRVICRGYTGDIHDIRGIYGGYARKRQDKGVAEGKKEAREEEARMAKQGKGQSMATRKRMHGRKELL